MPKYYIRLVNDEMPAPLYVERGLGFGGVKLTGSLKDAKRYETEQEAEKIAALARSQKDKERGGECTTVEIVAEESGESGDGWETRVRFELPASGSESCFQMKKTDVGIISRYSDINGAFSKEYAAQDMTKAVSDWINCVGAWFAAKVTGRGGK